MRKILPIITLLLFVSITVPKAYAATTQASESCTIPHSRLDWRIDASTSTNTVKDCVIAQFNPTLGKLNSVSITAEATTDTVQKMENKDVSPHTMNSTVTVNLNLKNTASTSDIITLSIAAADATLVADAFDGTLDYAGTSGKSFPIEYAHDNTTVSYSSASDITQFSGTGSLTFPVYAIAQWSCTGSGNAQCGVDTYATAAISVTYTYEIPEPDLIINSCTTQTINNDTTGIYPIHMANQGNADINGDIIVTGTLPSCLSYQNVTSTNWTCTNSRSSDKDTFTCTFTGIVPAGASVPELPIKVKAHACTNLGDSYKISVQTNGETKTTNNSLTCSVGLGSTESPDIDDSSLNTPTPSVAIVKNDSITDQDNDTSASPSNRSPQVLSSNSSSNSSDTDSTVGNVLGALASTGMIIAIPAIIGTSLVGLVYITRRKKDKSDKV
ncbi:choice-of-anchor E domain-containing protein [bacterium]|uniref:DUF11 domain-containing protein n=2 Tax=Katanobacteria TaxID=422282 RepID=A0A2M7X3G3_UNCKA|nr:choice-of-anchor E domain-containing protein [bacterium]PIP56145.1 MAG: hypothetical protein COX05_04605 [candidate division WWE3 bacterium CG22_combo_CG10-13_8_21_14_all_39_12]PJA40521.1 MAG: hypothetical protein CO179_02000 [candidate division WWE3 bacterium CG_4_9_14_3_um_filter_39_7]